MFIHQKLKMKNLPRTSTYTSIFTIFPVKIISTFCHREQFIRCMLHPKKIIMSKMVNTRIVHCNWKSREKKIENKKKKNQPKSDVMWVVCLANWPSYQIFFSLLFLFMAIYFMDYGKTFMDGGEKKIHPQYSRQNDSFALNFYCKCSPRAQCGATQVCSTTYGFFFFFRICELHFVLYAVCWYTHM